MLLFFGEVCKFTLNASSDVNNSYTFSESIYQSDDNLINVFGTMEWEDYKKRYGDNKFHPLRNTKIDFYLSTGKYLFTTNTSQTGDFFKEISRDSVYDDNLNRYYDIECRIVLSNSNYKIVDNDDNVYEKVLFFQYDYLNDEYNCSTIIDNSTETNRAIVIDQILKIGFEYINTSYYSENMTYLTVSYPYIYNGQGSKVSHYSLKNNIIYIESNEFHHPDYILHELGHYYFNNILQYNGIGIQHSFGDLLTENDISISQACEFSWNEALATFFSEGVQNCMMTNQLRISFMGDDCYENTNFFDIESSYVQYGNDHNEYLITCFLFQLCFGVKNYNFTFDDVIYLICENEITSFTVFLEILYSSYDSSYDLHKEYGQLMGSLNLSSSLENLEEYCVENKILTFKSCNNFVYNKDSYVDVYIEFYLYDEIGEIIYQSDRLSFLSSKESVLYVEIETNEEFNQKYIDYLFGSHDIIYLGFITYVDCEAYENCYYSNLKKIEKHPFYITSDLLNYVNNFTYIEKSEEKYYLILEPLITNTYKISYSNPELNLNENKNYFVVVDSNFNVVYDVNNSQTFKYLNEYENNLELVLYRGNTYCLCIYDFYNNWGKESLSKLTIDIADRTTNSTCDDYYINSYELSSSGYFWETIKFLYYGKFKYNFSINNLYSGIINLTLAKIYNGSIEYIINDEIQSINRGRTYNFDIKPGEEIYICLEYPLMDNDVIIDIMRSNESSFLIIPDKKVLSGGEVGTEVLLNDGEYQSSTMTVGFTKCMFLDDIAISPLRSSYYWFVDDENKATISSFGTLHAMYAGSVTVYAVYKNNYSIYSKIRILILEETKSNIVNLSFGLDIRTTGVSCGTYISAYNGNPILIGNYNEDDVFPINVNTTRLICLGSDSPADYLQYFIWSSSDPCISVSAYGTIKANDYSDNIVIITGIYKYNSRFRVVINLQIT